MHISINVGNKPTAQQREILHAAFEEQLFRKLRTQETFIQGATAFRPTAISVMMENGWLVLDRLPGRGTVPMKITSAGKAVLGVL